MKKIIISLVVLLVIGVIIWGYGHLETYCVFYPGIDTIYAVAYTEEAFDQIITGMKTEEVVRLIGRPLFVVSNEDGSETWWYSRDGKCKFGDFAWIGRSVQVRDSQVESTQKKVYYD